VVGLKGARVLIGEVGPTDEPPTLDNELSVRFAPGIDKQAAFKELQRKLDTDASLDHPLPSDISNFQRVDNLPIVLAGGVAALAAATMGHGLVSSIRRRRRDLSILKTLGFSRGQVRRTVASQATAIIVVSLLVGLPVGVALGRWAWGIFANQIGIVNEPRASVLPVLLTIPGALLLANLLAAAPGRVAARLRPALVLRTE
jgi:putative ABC transport system permease protein